MAWPVSRQAPWPWPERLPGWRYGQPAPATALVETDLDLRAVASRAGWLTDANRVLWQCGLGAACVPARPDAPVHLIGPVAEGR